ncbi:hypothetical protein AGLY_018102, partial [Aphis glycines]
GFILPNCTFFGKNILQELVNLDSKHDYRLAHKISERHILVNGRPGRMHVRVTVQLLSNSVSKAIAYYGKNKYIDNLTCLIPIQNLTMVWFQFNSQNGILNEMSSFIQNMRVHNIKTGGKEKYMLPFQKVILICNSSLKNVFLDLQKYHELYYILTRKLNQDVLEHLLSVFKGMSGSASSNITALDFKYWWYILGKHFNVIFTNNTNTEESSETNLLALDDC